MSNFWEKVEDAYQAVRYTEDFVKEMRRRPTKSEARLIYYLNMCHLRFTFQYRLKCYIYDFCFKKQRLLIELDGSWHDDGTQPQKDLEKQRFAELLGYKVLRFKNCEVWDDLGKIGKRIRLELRKT